MGISVGKYVAAAGMGAAVVVGSLALALPANAAAELAVTSPTTGETVGQFPTFTGTALNAGDTITVQGDVPGTGTVNLCSVVVSEPGETWSCTSTTQLSPGANSFVVSEADSNGTFVADVFVEGVNVAAEVDGPVLEPGGLMLAGGVAVAAAAVALVVVTRRRKLADQS